MPDANDLKAALERVLAGAGSDGDVSALRAAHSTGVLVSGDRAVALGGNATDVSIVSGDQIVFSIKGGDAASVLAALNSVTPARRHQVAPPPADFTGRVEEQRELLAAIEQGGVTISGLQGMGGIGKTALALKLVEQLKPRYPDAQIYLDLKGASAQPMPVTEALAHVIRSYLPAAKLPDSESDLRALYLTVLDGQRALLLMDNAFDARQVEPLVPPAGCALVVTSRWHFTLPGMLTKDLDALSGAEARALLLSIAPRIGDRADEIAKLCGYLPLALRLAASALAKYRNLKPEDYVQRLNNQQQRLQLIDASFSLSYDLLSEQLKERWRYLAVFPDSFADYSAAAIWEVETASAQDAMGELIAASMVEWNETADRYRLHDLSRVFADAKLSDKERMLGHKHHAMHYREVLAVTNKFYTDGGEALADGLALFDLERNNIEAAHAWLAVQDLEADKEIARLAMTYPDAGLYTLTLRLHSREWIRWLELALREAQRLNDRTFESSLFGNLGVAYDELGLTQQAIEFYEKQLTLSRELGLRQSEGTTLGNLGVVYWSLGDTRRAIELYEQRLTIARELGDKRGECSVLCNLGTVHWSLDEIQSAIDFYEQALHIARELGDRRSEGNALGGLGIASYYLGETAEAIDFYEQQLSISRNLGDRRGEANALWNMSLALYEQGECAQAIQNTEYSLALFELMEDPNAHKVREQLAKWREDN